MAEPLMLVGEVLVELLREGLAHLRPRVHSLLEQLREGAEPPDGVSFHAEDGATYTGVAILDHNKVMVMLAARTEPSLVPRTERHERPPLINPSPAPVHAYQGSQRSFYDPDEPDDRDWDEPPGYGRYK